MYLCTFVLLCWHFWCVSRSLCVCTIDFDTLKRNKKKFLFIFTQSKYTELKDWNISTIPLNISLAYTYIIKISLPTMTLHFYLNIGHDVGKYFSCKISQQRLYHPRHMCITNNLLENQTRDPWHQTINGCLSFMYTRAKQFSFRITDPNFLLIWSNQYAEAFSNSLSSSSHCGCR